MSYITLEEAAILFEEYKLETYPHSYNEYNYNMYDCLNRNHIIRRLPVYILTKCNEYIKATETRKSIKKYKDYTKKLFVDKNHLKRFFEKELSPKFSCYEFYGFGEEKHLQSEVTKSLRPELENITGNLLEYEDSWCDLFKEWHDESEILSVKMKYISKNE